MKNYIKIPISFFCLFLLALACTKEVGLITEVEFELSEQHTAEGYVNQGLPSTFTIVPEEVLENYEYTITYEILDGEGHFEDMEGNRVEPGKGWPVSEGLSAPLVYMGSKTGGHRVKITGADNFGISQDIEVSYELSDVPVVWEASSELSELELEKPVDVSLVFERLDTDLEVGYQAVYGLGSGAGSLGPSEENGYAPKGEYGPIVPGTYPLVFTPSEIGPQQLVFTLRDSNGQEIEAGVDFNVVEFIEVISITLSSQDTIKMKLGDEIPPAFTFDPPNATDQEVTVVSSDPDVVLIDENNVCIAVGLGTAEVTVTSVSNPDASDTVTVEVIPPDRVPVTGISVSQADPGATGAQRQLAATVLPENATDPSVTWSSADDTIATVDENGLLTGLSAGTVTITATSVSDPEVSGSVLVEITGVSLQSANDIEAFALNGQIETATIDTQAHTVSVTVPEGTALNVAPVLLIVSEGATLSPALLQVRDFTSPVQYTVTSGNGTGQVWTVTAKVLVLPVAGDTDITAFGLPGQNGSDIDTGNHTITVNVPDGTDLNIAPEILEVSPGASVAPAIGQVRDFSGAVAYTVTPETGTPQVWTVNVTVSQPTGSGENAITAFELPGQTGADINATTFTINVTVPDGTDLTGAPSVLDISADATVSPARTVLQDFSGAVTYTVTAENGDTQEWTVNTTVLPPTGSGANDITAFGLPVQNSADIDPGTNTVTVNVPDGTDLNVAPQVLGVSPGATVLPAIGAVQDFSGQVLYTVTAENGTPQVWTVNVTVSQPTGSAENDIVAFELPLQNSSTIDTDNNIISVNVDTGVPLNITPSIFNVSPSASVSPATTTVQDFSSTVTYVVTAENGNEKTWQVNVTLSPDDTPPVITLAGSNPQELTLGGTYNELGATATDNVDGDISANVISDATAVNMNVAGTYTVTYNVSDAAGNAATQVTRTVNVSAAPDTTPPVIALTGGEVNLTVGDTYVDPGYSATDNVDGDITGSVIVGGVVNTGVPGDYVVTYDVNDIAGNPAIQKTRIIEVRSPVDDTNPEINLFGGTMNLMVGDTYVDLGYYAIDDVDGDITDNVIVSGLPNMNVANSYTVTYDVSDQAGNPAPQKTRTVNVIAALDETAPEITLVGGTVSQTRGGTYVDPGYSATDNIDGDITANVVVSGLPNMSVVGSYTVTYNVSDVAGNPAPQKTRRVNVTAPQVTITYNSTTGVYTAPAGSRVMVTLRSQGAGKGNATVSGGGGSASTSWNGRNDTDEFSEIDSYEFTMPPSGSVTFSSNHREIFGDSDSRVTITNNQGGAEGFTVEKNGGIP